jgi:hypothetical protein
MTKKLIKLASSLEQLNSQLSNPKSRIGKTWSRWRPELKNY